MSCLRRAAVLMLACALAAPQLTALAQRRKTTTTTRTTRTTQTRPTTTRSTATQRSTTPTRSSTPTRTTTQARAASVPASQLTGVYRLDWASSQNPLGVARRATAKLVFGERRPVVNALAERLTSPYQISIQRRGSTIDIASTRAPRISFVADGREQTEQASDGHPVRTRAVLYGEQLSVSSSGSPDDDFGVNFDPIEGGRRLRVTRRIFSQELGEQVVVQSIYDKISSEPRWSVYGEQPPPEVLARASQQQQQQPQRNAPPAQGRRRQPVSPPVMTERQPRPTFPDTTRDNSAALNIPEGTRLTAVLNDGLSTARSRVGDRFTMTVRTPGAYDGATLEGTVSQVKSSGRIAGRSEMMFSFERIILRDGRTMNFAGVVEDVRPVGGEQVRVDNESGGSSGGGGGVQERDSQTDRTAQRVAIGAAVGAIIGAISGGGKGAAIGAAIGAGAGVGSVYAQGSDEIELGTGTEFTIRAGR